MPRWSSFVLLRLQQPVFLLQSKSERFPNGMGNDSGRIGLQHHGPPFQGWSAAKVNTFEDKYYKGRRPNGCISPDLGTGGKTDMPNFKGVWVSRGAGRSDYNQVAELGYGKTLKDYGIQTPGDWSMLLMGFGMPSLPWE